MDNKVQNVGMCTLPEKLSDCLELALHDLELCEAAPGYIIHMGQWHNFDTRTGECGVCLAGSLMAQTFNVDVKECVRANDFQPEVSRRLHALDILRVGRIREALNKIYPLSSLPGIPSYVSVTLYYRDPSAFKSDMWKIVNLLRDHSF